ARPHHLGTGERDEVAEEVLPPRAEPHLGELHRCRVDERRHGGDACSVLRDVWAYWRLPLTQLVSQAGAEATENAVTVSAVRKSTGRGNGKGLKLRTGALNGPRTAAPRPFR